MIAHRISGLVEADIAQHGEYFYGDSPHYKRINMILYVSKKFFIIPTWQQETEAPTYKNVYLTNSVFSNATETEQTSQQSHAHNLASSGDP